MTQIISRTVNQRAHCFVIAYHIVIALLIVFSQTSTQGSTFFTYRRQIVLFSGCLLLLTSVASIYCIFIPEEYRIQ
jgi:hypothetical protein